jgi:hypothetical protein
MQSKVNVRLHMKNGEVIECLYITRLRSFSGILREIYNTQHFTGFMRKGSTKKGILFVMMREVAAVELYEV